MSTVLKRRVVRLACALMLAGSALTARADEGEERQAIIDAARVAFLAGEYEQLETMGARLRTSQQRTASGTWALYWLHAGIEDAIDRSLDQAGSGAEPARFQQAGFEGLFARTREWSARLPDSVLAPIVHAQLLVTQAWSIRGHKYARDVKPEAWEPFRQHIAQAREHLERNKGIASVDPHWYSVMIKVATAQAWHRPAFDALVSEALDREPYFYSTYFHALTYLMPRWHGDLTQVDLFAREAVKRTQGRDGASLYARIYWSAAEAFFDDRVFETSHVSWPMMRLGFEDIMQRYPDAWNLNHYARFACQADDRTQTAVLLDRIGAATIGDAWFPPQRLADCRSKARLH